jgi:hypothetical protein
MKKLILLLPLLVLISCSVQKRKYQNGYYVEWNHKKGGHDKVVSKKQSTKKTSPLQEKNTEITINSGDKVEPLATNRQSFSDVFKRKLAFLKSGEDSCDVIVFKDGAEVRSKVEEVGINEIKYKRCDSPNGPMYVAKKSDIFMIKYMNGTKEVIKSAEPEIADNYQAPLSSYKTNSYKKQYHPLATASFITSMVSVIASWFMMLFAVSGGNFDTGTILFLPFLTGILAAALAIAALMRIGEQPDIYKGKGLAVPALVFGLIIAFIFSIIITGFFV